MPIQLGTGGESVQSIKAGIGRIDVLDLTCVLARICWAEETAMSCEMYCYHPWGST